MLTVDWRGSEAQPGGTRSARSHHRRLRGGRWAVATVGDGAWGRALVASAPAATCAPSDHGPIDAHTSTGQPETDLRGRSER